MRIAFYAPMKWPGHAVPSGDRLLARMFLAALQRAGHTPAVASRLRSWEGAGDAARQARLASIGARAAKRLIRHYRDRPDRAPELWFTYHVYHKAPDWIGPTVSDALGIPYVIAEASLSDRQVDGPWRRGHAAAAAAIRQADAVVCVNPADVPGVAAARRGRSPPVELAPFMDVDAFVGAGIEPAAQAAVQALDLPPDSPRLVTVAMMRHGDKLLSYRALADALGGLQDLPWHLVVVGDGAARAEVEHAFGVVAPQRVRYVGAQPAPVVAALLGRSDLFTWPAVAEVIGMALLEAQACGLPVVAGRRPGVQAVVDDARTGLLVRPGSTTEFAAAVRALLVDPARRALLARQAGLQVRARHDLSAAARVLGSVLAEVLAGRGGA
jgi:glycosyltransferase involved in cell wall biosynthesis